MLLVFLSLASPAVVDAIYTAAFHSLKHNNLTVPLPLFCCFCFVAVANAKDVGFSSLLRSVARFKRGYVEEHTSTGPANGTVLF